MSQQRHSGGLLLLLILHLSMGKFDEEEEEEERLIRTLFKEKEKDLTTPLTYQETWLFFVFSLE